MDIEKCKLEQGAIWNWTHTPRNSSREIPRYIFTIIIICLIKEKFFSFLKKSSITPLLLLNFHLYTHYNLAKKGGTLFLKWTSYIFLNLKKKNIVFLRV